MENCQQSLDKNSGVTMSKIFYVDIPDQTKTLMSDEGGWINVNISLTKQEAIEWIRSNIGWCDDEGRICLITEGEGLEDDDSEIDSDDVYRE